MDKIDRALVPEEKKTEKAKKKINTATICVCV